MKVVEPYFEILYMPSTEEIMRVLELAARNCWKSEGRIKEGSAEDLMEHLLRVHHDSVFEHMGATLRLIDDRGILAEISRHRTGVGFSVESTRYANYSKEKFGSEITVIRPFYFKVGTPEYTIWEKAMQDAEKAYLSLISMGKKAQEARAVLPFSLKTDIVFTANFRELRHILKLRCGKASHPSMRQAMLPILAEMYRRVPVLFKDLYEVHREEIEGAPEPKKVKKKEPPIVTLICTCCGQETKGRQWYNRDKGFGICPACIGWMKASAEECEKNLHVRHPYTPEAMHENYGVAGYNYLEEELT